MSRYLTRCDAGHFIGDSGVCWHCRVATVRRQMRYEDRGVVLMRRTQPSIISGFVRGVSDAVRGVWFASLLVWGACVSMLAKQEETIND